MARGALGLSARSWSAPRVDLRLLAGLVLLATALAGGVMFASQMRITEPAVVAARTIAPGDVITAADLTVTEVRLEGDLGTLAFGEAEISSVIGRTATQRIHAGALVLRPDLGSGPVLGPGEVAVTVPVAADAVFAQLRRGDEVAIVATSEPGRTESATSLLLERATVYHVAADAGRVSLGGGSAGEEGGRIANVTLVVPQTEAEGVVHALVNGRVTLVLVPAR